jgi:hypothetical protein
MILILDTVLDEMAVAPKRVQRTFAHFRDIEHAALQSRVAACRLAV